MSRSPRVARTVARARRHIRKLGRGTPYAWDRAEFEATHLNAIASLREQLLTLGEWCDGEHTLAREWAALGIDALDALEEGRVTR